MALLATGNILMGMGTLPISMMGPLLIIECADYNEWCGRPRMEGTLGSINGFANKIGSAIAEPSFVGYLWLHPVTSEVLEIQQFYRILPL